MYGVTVRLTVGGAGRGRRSPQPPEGVSHPREPVTRRGVCNAVTTQLTGVLAAAAAAAPRRALRLTAGPTTTTTGRRTLYSTRLLLLVELKTCRVFEK